MTRLYTLLPLIAILFIASPTFISSMDMVVTQEALDLKVPLKGEYAQRQDVDNLIHNHSVLLETKGITQENAQIWYAIASQLPRLQSRSLTAHVDQVQPGPAIGGYRATLNGSAKAHTLRFLPVSSTVT